MASLTIPYDNFVPGTTIVSSQADQNNAAILTYINARNAGSTAWDAIKTASIIATGANHAFGIGATLANIGVRFTNTVTSPGGLGGFVAGLDIDPTLTGGTGDTSYQTFVNIAGFGITTQASETVAVVCSLQVKDPQINVGAGGTVSVASLIYLDNVPTEGTVNAAIYANTGTIVVPSGSVAAPTVRAKDDLDTGIYWPSADSFAIACGGTKVFQVDASSAYHRSGAVNAPGITYIADDNTGFYWISSGIVGYTADGVLAAKFSATDITIPATSNQLVLGATRTVTVTAPTPASSSRTVTIPDLSGDYSVVGTIGNQTLAGTKTFSSTIVAQGGVSLNADNAQDWGSITVRGRAVYTRSIHSGANGLSILTTAGSDVRIYGNDGTREDFRVVDTGAIQVFKTTNQVILGTTLTTTVNATAPAGSSRVWTIPDISANGTFAALEASQTFSGTTNTFSGDLYTVTWTDYSGSSTIVGWTTPTAKIRYKKIGKLVWVQYQITGTSNAGTTSFTLPFANNASIAVYNMSTITQDNGVDSNVPGVIEITASSSTCSVYKTWTSTGWTSSGGKQIYGQFFYQTT